MSASGASASAGSASGSRSGSGSGPGSMSSSSTDSDTGSTFTYGMIFSVSAFTATDADGAVVVDDTYCRFNTTEAELTGCKTPRNCGACLRVTGCMIDSSAQCVSAAQHYNASLDFRAATLYTNKTLNMHSSVLAANASVVQDWVFPSTMVDYCGYNDSACESCRESVFVNASDNRFCVGASGCTCIAQCDSPQQDKVLHDATICEKKPHKKGLPQPLMWVIGSGIAIVICVGIYWWIYRRTRGDEAEEDERGVDIKQSKDYQKSEYKPPSMPHPETPVMELSVSEYPRFTLDSTTSTNIRGIGAQTEEAV